MSGPEQRMETLAEERRVHALTIEMGNLCGQPSDSPGGGSASSVAASVTCPACWKTLTAARLSPVRVADDLFESAFGWRPGGTA